MGKPEDNTPLGESISEIIDRTTKIVHEEIELAKAEMSVALQDLLRGSVAGIVGGVFAFFGLFILLIALSFLVADAVGAWYPWLGFFIVAFLCFALGGILAFVALKKIKKGSQLAPTQAIDEAKQTKSALQAEADKEIETIDSTAVEEPTATKPPVDKVFPVAGDVKPVEPPEPVKSPEVAEAEAAADDAKEDLKEARDDANELGLDAKEAKRRAKQEAKEAKIAAKAAKKAEAEAAKAEAVAAKQAEKAQQEAEKARAKAEKEAEKNAKKAAKASGKQPEAPAEQPPTEQGEPQRYVAPTPPAPPQTPPAPPTSGGPTPPPTPPAPPTDPTENN